MKDFDPKVKTRIWPILTCMRQIRSTAEPRLNLLLLPRYHSRAQSRVTQQSMSLRYEPSSEPLHISVTERAWAVLQGASLAIFCESEGGGRQSKQRRGRVAANLNRSTRVSQARCEQPEGLDHERCEHRRVKACVRSRHACRVWVRIGV